MTENEKKFLDVIVAQLQENGQISPSKEVTDEHALVSHKHHLYKITVKEITNGEDQDH